MVITISREDYRYSFILLITSVVFARHSELSGPAPKQLMDHQTFALAETIWNYHLMKHQVAKADAILVLCSHDERVAERGAQLFLEGWAPLIIFSGGQGAITKKLWDEPEAERFARIAMSLNVPRESILVEPNSTNTGENVQFTRKLLEERGLDPHKFIVVQKPYMERRAFATFRRYWPEKEVIVTSPQVSFRDYLAEYSNRSLSAADVVEYNGRRSTTD